MQARPPSLKRWAEHQMTEHQTKSVPVTVEREVLPLNEFFAFLGIGPTKGYELIRSGQLKTRKLGRRRLGLISEGREFLKSLPTE
jgi:hypothetical protein